MNSLTLYEVRNDVAWIMLNQPDKRNALSEDLITELRRNLASAHADPQVRFVVLTGAGSAFCAGADLKSLGGAPTATGADPAADNPMVALMQALWNSPKPVIGRINGHAFGGGLGLVAACDLTVAAEPAMFSFSEVRVGVIPAMISVLCIPKLGAHNAMWLFLTGERFTATRAVQLGLIHRSVPAADLDAAVNDVVGMIRLGGPNAIREAKQLVRQIPRLSMEDGFRYTSRKIAELFASEEAVEGMSAFIEKRKPKWAQ
ncbi:MAG: enoyl-CoA hydratase/isomerase family protein [Acidobacteria bacterium]|nr:enoyl-CoA hydratase/isomerase family protein [Acidobacteriota bacterium]MBI3655431.1 enoyl-CoA hydratase/isomerase family protein [Acidobacteriota bacterium]